MQTQQIDDDALRGSRVIEPSNDDDTLLNSNQVRARVGGVSAMCLWRWVRDDRVQFPEPVKINGRNYWYLGPLRRWQQNQPARRAA